MADPLAPITGNSQHRRPHPNSNGSIKSFKSFATAETHPEEMTFSKDPAAPSSPFLYEAERSSRSPTKPSSPSKTRPKSRSPTKFALNDERERIPLTEDTLRANEISLETPRTVQIKNAAPSHRNYSPSESAFSAFSAIHNADMTNFTKMALSPSKATNRLADGPASPTRSRPNTPGTTRPNRQRDFDIPESPVGGEDNTTQLIDFTEQLNMAGRINRSPVRTRNSPSKESRDQQYKRDAAGFRPATPNQLRELTNLLDFDLPPAPTPRSLPTITPRELESLKAGFMSQINGLKATISGKEAEISALKAATSDAENRVGEALEQLRETRDIKESLEQEKADWETRDRETQRVLKEVRAQIQDTDRERLQLEDRLAEAERRAEDAELRVQEAESKAAGTRAGVQAAEEDDGDDAAAPGSPSNKAVQVAVEKVARELHALYKAKHEAKVGQLKKSYEARWIKRTDTLKADIERLERDLQESRVEVDALRHELDDAALAGARVDAMTTVSPAGLAELHARDAEIADLKREVERLAREVESAQQQQQQSAVAIKTEEGQQLPLSPSQQPSPELENKITLLTSEIEVLRSRTKRLAKDLELSREENSALVATVDEFLSLDLDGSAASAAIVAAAAVPAPSLPDSAPPSAHASVSAGTSNAGSRPGSAMSGATVAAPPLSLSSSTGGGAAKPSGLKGFGFGQSRIGLGPLPSSSLKRSVSGSGSRSGIMSNIERMGMGRVRGTEQQ